jgi:hypothetical protein
LRSRTSWRTRLRAVVTETTTEATTAMRPSPPASASRTRVHTAGGWARATVASARLSSSRRIWPRTASTASRQSDAPTAGGWPARAESMTRFSNAVNRVNCGLAANWS